VDIEKINILVKPKISIPFSASQIHGIYDKDVETSPSIAEIIDGILKYLNTTDMVVGHNIEFDEEIIR
jgi:DNA polymerase III epsilon subunit-like protein